jgi:hypothetical protein
VYPPESCLSSNDPREPHGLGHGPTPGIEG